MQHFLNFTRKLLSHSFRLNFSTVALSHSYLRSLFHSYDCITFILISSNQLLSEKTIETTIWLLRYWVLKLRHFCPCQRLSVRCKGETAPPCDGDNAAFPVPYYGACITTSTGEQTEHATPHTNTTLGRNDDMAFVPLPDQITNVGLDNKTKCFSRNKSEIECVVTCIIMNDTMVYKDESLASLSMPWVHLWKCKNKLIVYCWIG